MRATTLSWMLPAMGLALVAGGCSSVGDFCHSDDDCGSGLRCTANGGSRGVCTYPGGTPDQSAESDQKLPDSGYPEMVVDSQQSDIQADSHQPDVTTPDASIPEASTPDVSTPDAAAPDAAKPDAGADTGSSG